MAVTRGWRFFVDRGGTFTDIVAQAPGGQLATRKLLSENPGRLEDATLAGIRDVLGTEANAPLPVEEIDAVTIGTTVATNAMLEGSGEPVLLVVTRGFADVLRIGYQNRPQIFARRIEPRSRFYARVIEVDERLDASGAELVPLDLESAQVELRRAYGDGLRAVAVVCMHSHRNPEHEVRIGMLAEEIGFTQISLSHEVSNSMRIVPRGDTTVVDAYLSPVLRSYVDGLNQELAGSRLMFMRSSGGLADAHHFFGRDAILSGPAGGIVGMARSSALAGFDKVIGFDMGGTSTDVSHYAGEFERTTQTEVAGVRLRVPALAIHTIAAGGGSVLKFDGSRFRVGPASAGSDPGPACYGHGGPLTVTDANLLLGNLHADYFPSVFGSDGDQPLDGALVRALFVEMARDVQRATGIRRTAEEVAAGFREIAVTDMANAIKKVSVQRGRDVTEYALVTFGGAGGQHACAVADALGISSVLVPPMAGVLSAYGLGLADTVAMRERALNRLLDEAADRRIGELGKLLESEARAELRDEGIAAQAIRVRHRVHLSYEGTDTVLVVDRGPLPAMRARFEADHLRQFAFLMPDKALVVEAVSVEAVGSAEQLQVAPFARRGAARALQPVATVPLYDTTWIEVPLYRRDDLPIGISVVGPAIIAEDSTSTIVADGWRAVSIAEGHLCLERFVSRRDRRESSTAADPIRLEIFNHLFMTVAEQMGAQLERTAHSVNIKERLDFSCGVFDREGGLVANAPHMPVHLGSMGESVRQVIAREHGSMHPGDVYALNDPYRGGTHLPDITVVMPVFDRSDGDDSGAVLFYVAVRGHHAEIGGITPGSMPPFSRVIEEEGVLLDNWLLVSGGRFREAETRALLESGRYPSRNPAANLADLRAQVAACEKGLQELQGAVEHFGLDVVQAYMGHVQANAEEQVRRVIAALRDGEWRYEHDSGFVICVAVTVDRARREARVDFTGTSAQLSNNFNAPSAVARAAVLYVFRTLVAEDIPLNDGCLKPLELVIPEASMLAPRSPAATVAGNVETSQAITSALYGALGVQAEGSGTMNNVTFGNERVQYYETVGSGSGAGEGFDGADVVQTHMTNSRLTDPEVLEWRYPVRLESFAVRDASGGRGRWRGGDGGVRRIRFLEPMVVGVLSGHRRIAPYGMAGGGAGACGRNYVERSDGSTVELGGVNEVGVGPGDVLVVETPGGGGYGASSTERRGSGPRAGDGAARDTLASRRARGLIV